MVEKRCQEPYFLTWAHAALARPSAQPRCRPRVSGAIQVIRDSSRSPFSHRVPLRRTERLASESGSSGGGLAVEQSLALAPWGCSREINPGNVARPTIRRLAGARERPADRGRIGGHQAFGRAWNPVWPRTVDCAGCQTAGPGNSSPASRTTEEVRKRFLTPFSHGPFRQIGVCIEQRGPELSIAVGSQRDVGQVVALNDEVFAWQDRAVLGRFLIGTAHACG
jgi:hypothetical protein